MAELIKQDHRWVLRTTLGVLDINFVHDVRNYRRSLGKGLQELLAKALGSLKDGRTVIDCTLGLGQDAVMLGRLGFQVVGYEKNEQIFVLLDQALREARAGLAGEEWVHRMNFKYGTAKQHWQNESSVFKEELVYLDPMFPEKKKSALPPLRMQIFQQLLGHEDSQESLELIELALKKGARRVVLKRSLKAPELYPGVIHSYLGTTVRYDLYKPRERP